MKLKTGKVIGWSVLDVGGYCASTYAEVPRLYRTRQQARGYRSYLNLVRPEYGPYRITKMVIDK